MQKHDISIAELKNKPYVRMTDEEKELAKRLGLVQTNRMSSGVRTHGMVHVTTAYWIHEKVPSEESVSGYYYKRECTCSSCGYHVNMERPICPHCGAIMEAEPKESK